MAEILSAGRYEVLAKLGEGGMGVVYRAHDRNLDTEVVIKMPRRSALEEPGFAERFAREIRSLVQLAHPNIVKILDVGTHDGLPFAVMQYLAGGSLLSRLPRDRDGKPLTSSPSTLAAWLPAIAQAIDFVHAQGYLHRDVKPANILFDIHGHPYLSDFGVIKVLRAAEGKTGSNLTGLGMVLGTPEYMAPELIMGLGSDGRVDQYALAATVYEVLAGRTPFQGRTPAAILVKQTTQKLRPLSRFNPEIPPAVAEAVERGLAKDPARRYPNCSALAQAILSQRDEGRGMRDELRQGSSSSLIPHPSSLQEEGPRVRMVCPSCGIQLQVSAQLARSSDLLCPHCRVPLKKASDSRDAVPPLLPQPVPVPVVAVPVAVPGRAEPETVRDSSLAAGPGPVGPRTPLASTLWEPPATDLLPEEIEPQRHRGTENPFFHLLCASVPQWFHSFRRLPALGAGVVLIILTGLVLRHFLANPGRFDLRQPPPLLVRRGEERSVMLAVERDQFPRPIRIKAADPAAGLTIAPVELEKDQDQVALRVAAAPDARPGSRTVRLAATGDGGRENETTLRVEVIGPNFRLIAPPPQVLTSGQTCVVPVPLDADGFPGPVELEVLRPEDHPALRARFLAQGVEQPGSPLPLQVEASAEHGEAVGELLLQAKVNGIPAGDPVALKYRVKPFLGNLPELPDAVLYLVVSPDGQRVAAAHGREVFLGNILTGKKVLQFQAHAGNVAGLDWSNDGFVLASVGDSAAGQESKGRPCLWDPATGQQARLLEPGDREWQCVAVNPAGTRLVAGGPGGWLGVWDLSTGRLKQTWKGHAQAVQDITWSPDGKWLASACADGTVILWETQGLTQHKILAGHQGGATNLAFRSDSLQLAAGSARGRVHLWQVPDGTRVRDWPAHEAIIHSIQYSPEGSRLLTGSEDKLAKVWDAGSGNLLLPLAGHTAAVTGANYTPDGKRIVTGSRDKTIRVWDAKTGK